jgi:hypothetical protein
VVFYALTNPLLLFNEAAHDVVQSILNAVFPSWVDGPASGGGLDTSLVEGPGIPLWLAPFGGFATFVYHFGFSLWHGAGVIATLAAPFAIGWGLWSRNPLLQASAVLALGWYVVVSLSPVTLSRYVTPMFPALAILQAAGIGALARRFAPHRQSLAATLAAAALLAQPAVASVRFDVLAARSDTRVQAAEWLSVNARGSRVVVVGTRFWHYGEPRLPRGVRRVALPAGGRVGRRLADYVVAHEHELFWSSLPERFLERNAAQLELLVDLDPRAGATGTPVFESNDAWYLPIAGLTGVSAPGPRLRIYRVR